MEASRTHSRLIGPRRGSAYVAVLGASMVVATIGMGALAIVRSQRLTVQAQGDTASARLYAQSLVEWGAQLVAADSAWRSGHPSGAWYSSQPLGDAVVTLEGTDPLDNDLSNRPTDPLVLKGTAIRGTARQIVQATLVASGPPLDCLRCAIHTGGQFHVRSGQVVTVSGGPVSTNGSLRNDGTITGDVECTLASSFGTIGGTLTMPASTKAMPSSGVLAMYRNLGTLVVPGSTTIDKRAIGPGYNPWGSANPDGVYVIVMSGNMTLKNFRCLGTLVVVGAGKTLTLDSAVVLQNYRADYPALITDADLVLQYSGSLSESTAGVNLNPAGVPYQGVTDSDTTDTYTCEIVGLIHTRGALTLNSSPRVRGVIIAESTAGSDAVDVGGTPQITYDPTLWASPPMGYMKSVTMSFQPGSWRQVVLP
jgi:hypothetical protein